MSFIILTAIITGLTRCQVGIETAGSSRYRINGVIYVICLYVWFLQSINNKYLKQICSIFFSLFYLFFISIKQQEFLSIRKEQSLSGVLLYHSGNYKKLNGFEQDLYKSILVESERLQTYMLPSFLTLEKYFPYSKNENIDTISANSEQFYPAIDRVIKIKDGYLIEGWGFIEEQNSDNQKVFIGIKNISHTKLVFFSTTQVPRYDLNPYFKKNYIENAGFFARLKDNDVKPGENEIWVMIKVNDKVKLSKTDKKLIK